MFKLKHYVFVKFILIKDTEDRYTEQFWELIKIVLKMLWPKPNLKKSPN